MASEYSADLHTFDLDRALYPVTAALTILSVSRSTFYSLVDQGELELVKLGRRKRIYSAVCRLNVALITTDVAVGTPLH